MSRPAVLESTDWFGHTWALLEARAAEPGVWNVDDLRDLGAGEPATPNHFGVLFRKAQAAGLIAQVGYVPSRRKQRHGSIQRIWVGAAWVGDAAA